MVVRCLLCGQPAPEDDQAVKCKLQAHQQAEKEGKAGKFVWICPRCSGRARHEAEQEGKGLRRGN